MKQFKMFSFYDVFDNDYSSNGKIQKKNYSIDGLYPIIDQSFNFISGYSDNNGLVYNASINKPVIVFGDHTCIVKFIDFNFIQYIEFTS